MDAMNPTSVTTAVAGALGAQNGPAPTIDAGGACTVSSKVLHSGRAEGMEVIEIDNGTLRVAVLPQRGMGVWKAWLGDFELGWRSPVRGPVHPSYVPLFDPSGFGWLEGFDELLCRCGLTSNGAPDFDRRGALLYPLHGRIANLPAENVRTVHDPDTGAVSLTGVVYETRFHHQKLRLTSTLTMTPGAAAFSVHDEISNLSDAPATAQLLYHFNLGLPLLDPGARVVAPVRNLTPRNERAAAGLAHWDICGAPDASYTEQVYFMDLHADEDGKTMALLKNATGDRGASVHFDTRQLPFLILWKNTCAVADGYVVGLEPGTNFPNPRSFEEEHGRVIRLAAGESASFDVRFAFHGSPPEITGIESQIERLRTQGKANPAAAATTGWTMR